ncbi:uncharacterized protein LOC144119850 [Amblyomma americanum]
MKVQSCNFGDLKEPTVRDQLLCGTADKKLRTRLLRLKDLTPDKAIEYCKAAELTECQSQAWEKDELNLNTVRKKQEEQQGATRKHIRQCPYCNRSHEPRKCPAWGKTCGICRKRYHFAVCCRTKSIHEVDCPVPPEAESDDEFQILAVNISDVLRSQDWIITTTLSNRATRIKVDTGAQANLLPHALFLKVSEVRRLKPSYTLLTSYDGALINHFGTVRLPLRIGGTEEPTEFFVVKKGKQSLLGLQACERVGLASRIQTIQIPADLKKQVFSDFTQLFEGLGCVKES